MKKNDLIYHYYSVIKRFYRNQHGVYTVMKENGLTAPIDLMLVSDFSKSMLWEVGKPERDKNGREFPQGKFPDRKIDILREVVGNISEILLPKQLEEGISPYNRMGFTTFAAGARQRHEKYKCVLPYYLKEGKKPLQIKKVVLDRYDRPRYVTSVYDGVIDRDNHCGTSYAYGYYDHGQMCSVEIEPKELVHKALEIGDWETINSVFERYLDVSKTVGDISKFDGKNKDYEFTFEDERFCLGGNEGKETTQAWFNRENSKFNIHSELKKIDPKGGTAATSGLIVGANIMMEKNKDKNAEPDQVKSNTQRILLVLSDGGDNQPSKTTLIDLFKGGLCDKIKERIDTLQDKKFPTLPTRIAFVAFGYKPTQEQSEAWKSCVGNHYYQVENKEQLLKSFQQIISLDEEVGRAVRFRKKPTSSTSK